MSNAPLRADPPIDHAAMIRYRNDIDGLRAVAIVPVVLFHADVPAFGGGYLGVDIFFVISGYLITRQLLDSKASGWKLIAEFYERRVRRIAPAFLAMLATVLLAVAALFPAADVLRTAKSTVSALLFAANIRFYGKTGYFDSAATDEPLLHTWSLAVEEQFYLFFPLLLLFVRRWRTVPALAMLALASLALGQLSLSRDPAWAFYLLPGRAWELLAGALLAASRIGNGSGIRPAHREALAAAGLALILIPIVSYDVFTPVPGIATLPPVIGTVMLLALGEGSAVSRLLSLRPLVWIGLISFSLYLWHWPIFVITRQLWGAPDSMWTAGLILAALATAFLSYRYVERPCRNRTRFSHRQVLIGSGAAALIIASGCGALIALRGLPDRSPAAERFFQAAAQTEALFQTSPCLVHDGTNLPPLAPCVLGRPSSRIDGILWGDSHADTGNRWWTPPPRTPA